ncbi:MAG: hypothetical protein WKG32_22415 [Gemmatimonadaceae bacterium]
MSQQYGEYRDTALWRAVADALADLQASGEVRVETAPDYVIGFLCRELAMKWVVAASALTRER